MHATILFKACSHWTLVRCSGEAILVARQCLSKHVLMNIILIGLRGFVHFKQFVLKQCLIMIGRTIFHRSWAQIKHLLTPFQHLNATYRKHQSKKHKTCERQQQTHKQPNTHKHNGVFRMPLARSVVRHESNLDNSDSQRWCGNQLYAGGTTSCMVQGSARSASPAE